MEKNIFFKPPQKRLFLGRGYTGHEHLPKYGLINMNARLYDPAIGRFLSPDPYVQTPDFSQSFNRYSYAMNNPFKYTDPDGEIAWFIAGAIVGAYIGGISSNKGQLNPFRWDYKSPMTYLSVGFGAIFGGYGAYAITNPGSFAFAGNLSSPWVTAGVSAASLGVGTDWNYNFYWSTAAGGGGEYGKFNDPAQSVDKAIAKTRQDYYTNRPDLGLSSGLFYTSTALAASSELFYSKYFNSWMGKNGKFYSQDWGGNKYTGSMNKFARATSLNIGLAGKVIGGWNLYSTYKYYDSGEISSKEFLLEEGVNVFSLFGGVYGAAWGIGWEAGKYVTNQSWYQQTKYRFWYNRWQHLYGEPSEQNSYLWEYFYNNYK